MALKGRRKDGGTAEDYYLAGKDVHVGSSRLHLWFKCFSQSYGGNDGGLV